MGLLGMIRRARSRAREKKEIEKREKEKEELEERLRIEAAEKEKARIKLKSEHMSCMEKIEKWKYRYDGHISHLGDEAESRSSFVMLDFSQFVEEGTHCIKLFIDNFPSEMYKTSTLISKMVDFLWVLERYGNVCDNFLRDSTSDRERQLAEFVRLYVVSLTEVLQIVAEVPEFNTIGQLCAVLLAEAYKKEGWSEKVGEIIDINTEPRTDGTVFSASLQGRMIAVTENQLLTHEKELQNYSENLVRKACDYLDLRLVKRLENEGIISFEDFGKKVKTRVVRKAFEDLDLDDALINRLDREGIVSFSELWSHVGARVKQIREKCGVINIPQVKQPVYSEDILYLDLARSDRESYIGADGTLRTRTQKAVLIPSYASEELSVDELSAKYDSEMEYLRRVLRFVKTKQQLKDISSSLFVSLVSLYLFKTTVMRKPREIVEQARNQERSHLLRIAERGPPEKQTTDCRVCGGTGWLHIRSAEPGSDVIVESKGFCKACQGTGRVTWEQLGIGMMPDIEREKAIEKLKTEGGPPLDGRTIREINKSIQLILEQLPQRINNLVNSVSFQSLNSKEAILNLADSVQRKVNEIGGLIFGEELFLDSIGFPLPLGSRPPFSP